MMKNTIILKNIRLALLILAITSPTQQAKAMESGLLEGYQEDRRYTVPARLNPGKNSFSFRGEILQGEISIRIMDPSKTTCLCEENYRLGKFSGELTYNASDTQDVSFLVFGKSSTSPKFSLNQLNFTTEDKKGQR